MFTFSFIKDETEKEEKKKPAIEWKECQQITTNELSNITINNLIETCETKDLDCKSTKIKYFSSSDILVNILKDLDDPDEYSVLKAEENHSDLIAGSYEGGLKIWECSYDLLNFIEKFDFENKTVSDIGCGAGLIGILAVLKGATAIFQDYNKEVIKYITIPNLMLNFMDNQAVAQSCSYFYGDWLSFSNLLKQESKVQTCDYIFTSETIYNKENYSKLHELFKTMLKDNGEIYLAAKSYYFGVGGGTNDFKDFIKKENVFHYEVVWKFSNGLEREIIKLKFKS